MSNPEVEFELSDRGRAFATRLANNPLDLFQGKTLGWLEDFIRITVGNIEVGTGPGAAIGTHTVGHLAWICKDLTAFTGEYVYEDESGQYLYLNGAAVDQIVYANLYEFYGPNAYGTDASGLFLLPDARGRAPFIVGTSVNADLGDHDGISVTLRQALHQHAVTGAVSLHTHDDGTLSVASHNHSDGTLTVASHLHSDGTLSVASHSHGVGSLTNGTASGDTHTHGFSGTTGSVSGAGNHTHPPHPDLLDFWGGAASGGVLIAGGADFRIDSRGSTGTAGVDHTHNYSGTTDAAGAGGSHSHTISGSTAADSPDVSGNTGSASPDVSGDTGSASPDVTGNTGSAAPSLSGTAGSGMSLDAPAHIFIGSLLVRF